MTDGQMGWTPQNENNVPRMASSQIGAFGEKVDASGEAVGGVKAFDATAKAAILPLLIVWFSGLLIVLIPALIIGAIAKNQMLTVLLCIAWTGAGFLSWNRDVEKYFAKWLLKFREPFENEKALLMPAWERVAARAGVDPTNYDLWIDDDMDLNAAAAGAHIVGVTRGALARPADQLEAVLAHEYGHHVGGHVKILALQLWYALPLRLASRFGFVEKILIGVLAASQTIGRRAEFRADETAVRLGYGPPLVGLFYQWLNEGHDDDRKHLSITDRIFQSHPAISKRIQRVEKTMASLGIDSGAASRPAPTVGMAPPATGGPIPTHAPLPTAAFAPPSSGAPTDNSGGISMGYPPVSPNASVVLYDLRQWTNADTQSLTANLSAGGVPTEMRDGWLAVSPAACQTVEMALRMAGRGMPQRTSE